MKNPLKSQKKKLWAQIVGDFLLSSILEITEYKDKNFQKLLAHQKITYLTKTGI